MKPRLHQETKYIEDVDFVEFYRYEISDLFNGYAYEIDSARIDLCLKLLKEQNIYELVLSEMRGDWEDAIKLRESYLIDDSLKHGIRIAFLILDIPVNGIKPVNIDTFSRSCSHLEGHHRLLALKHLGYDYFPAYLSGDVNILETLHPIPVYMEVNNAYKCYHSVDVEVVE